MGNTTHTPLTPVADSLAWDSGRLVIRDEKLAGKVSRPALSASTAEAMTGCAARFAAEKLLPRADDPFSPAAIGTAAHSVLECLYGLENGKRNKYNAVEAAAELAEREWSRHGDQDVSAKKTLWLSQVVNAYQGIFDIEDPDDVNVHRTEWHVNGIKIADDVPFVGYIDRTDLVDGTLRPLDFKTGKQKPPSKFFGDPHGDQLRAYALAIEALTGEKPTSARVYYTKFGKSQRVAMSRPALRKTEQKLNSSWKKLNRYTGEASFPTKTSGLCSYCPLVNICPAGQEAGYSAKIDAPTADQLPIEDITDLGTDIDLAGHEAPEPEHSTSNNNDAQMGTDMTDWREAKPWEETSGFNPNSYSASAIFGTETLAIDTLHAAGQKVAPSSVRALSATLLSLADQVQTELQGELDRQAGLHTRIRGIIRSMLDVRPVPFGGDTSDWRTWIDKMNANIFVLLDLGVDLHDNGYPVEPWAVFASDFQPETSGDSTDEAEEAEAPKTRKAKPVVVEDDDDFGDFEDAV